MSVFVCGEPKPPKCTSVDCLNPAELTCAELLVGRAQGRKCGRLVCTACRGKSDRCPPHQRKAARDVR